MTSQPRQLCPLTLKELPLDPLDVARVWSETHIGSETGCGHRCTLSALVRYLQDGGPLTEKGGGHTDSCMVGSQYPPCPVCQKHPVICVSDEIATREILNVTSSSLENENEKCEDDVESVFKTFSFRYGRQVYRLAVNPNSVMNKSWFGGWNCRIATGAVQRRICSALGLTEDSLKVLSRGKVMWPRPLSDGASPPFSAVAISSVLLETSAQEDDRASTSFKKKPSLVVMGTLKGRELRDPTATNLHGGGTFRNMGMFEVLNWTLVTFFGSVRTFFTGVFLFFRSIFFLPSPRPAAEGHND